MVFEFVPDIEHKAEDYIQQHSPEADQERGDAHLISAGTDDSVDPIQAEDSPQDFNFLQQFIYDQNRQPRKKDIVYYYDMDEEDFAKVKILSRSNYRYYYNI